MGSLTPSCRPAHPAKAYERQRGVFDILITIPHPVDILLDIRAARPVDLPELRKAVSLRARAKERVRCQSEEDVRRERIERR